MSNEILYGLKFNTEDLDRVLKKVAVTESKIKESAKKRYESESKTASFYEKEMVNLKKQSLMMNKKLTKAHLNELETLYKHYYSNIKGLDQKSADELTKQQLNNVKQRQKITSSVTNVPLRVAKYLATSTILYQGLGAASRGYEAIKEYDQNIANVKSVLSGLNEVEIKRLKILTQDEELTRKYGASFAEQAASVEVLAKAGLNLEQSMVLLAPSIKLAKISGDDLAVTTQRLTEMLQGFNQPMGSANNLVDLLAKGAAESSIDIKDLAESLQIFAPVSRAFGMTMEESIAWLSSVGKAGLKGREAANAMSRELLRLTKNQKEVNEFFIDKNTGIDSRYDKETGRLKSLNEILKIVSNSNLDLGEKQKILGIYTFKTNEQLSVSLNTYKELLPAMKEVTGEADKQAEIKLGGLIEELNRLKATWDNLFVSQGYLSEAIKYSTKALREFIELGQTLDFYEFFTGEKADSERDALKQKALQEKALLEEKAQIYNQYLTKIKSYTKDALLEEKKAKEYTLLKITGTSMKDFDKLPQANQNAIAKVAMETQQQLDALNVEIGLRGKKGSYATGGGTGSAKTPKESYDSLEAFLLSLEKLRNKYSERELTGIEKIQAEINNTYLEQQMTLRMKNFKTAEEYYLASVRIAQDREKSLTEAGITWQLKAVEEWNSARGEAMNDAHEQQLKDTEDYLEKQKELRQKYQGIDGALSDLQKNMMDEIVLAEGKEELILNIKKDYAEQAMQLYREDWEKKNQVANAALGSMEAGYSSFTQAMSDDLQISKNESEAIWEAMKQSFITKIMEMAWAAALSGIFSFFMNPAQSFLGGFGQKGGLGAAMGGSTMGDTAGFGAGSIFNAPMSGGGGVSLPSMAMVQGTGGGANNNALINELRALRMVTASGMAQTVKAIAENTPVIQGKFLDAVDVFKASKVGERKANLVVSAK